MIRSIEELEAKLAEPSDALIRDLTAVDGDIMLLGIGGKMGPSLAKLARNALNRAGVKKTIWGVSRFSEAGLKEQLEQEGIRTIACDLLDDEQLQELPDVKNIIYMAGNKFGTTGREHFTWAMNSYLPGRVAEKFKTPESWFFHLEIFIHLPLCFKVVPQNRRPHLRLANMVSQRLGVNVYLNISLGNMTFRWLSIG